MNKEEQCNHPSTHEEQERYGGMPFQEETVTVCDICGEEI